MKKKKETKGAKKSVTVTKTYTMGEPTRLLIHNCIAEINNKMDQLCKRKPMPSNKILKAMYNKLLDKHTKLIEKNMGVSHININMEKVLRKMEKQLTTKTKNKKGKLVKK